MLDLPVGTVLKARPHHPIYKRGGEGVAVIAEGANGSDFFTIHWVSGDPGVPHFSGDVISVKHLNSWYIVIVEKDRDKYLPEGYKVPTFKEMFK